MNKKKVVVVIPVYKKKLTAFEKISLKQCIKILGEFDITFVAPDSLELSELKHIWKTATSKTFRSVHFSEQFFIDVGAYSRLMLSKHFYQQFFAFEYLLIYQLDAFVFKNELEYWCSQGYDYIGAPWMTHHNKGIAGVGNGGFSLRNIKKHLRVLSSFSYIKKPADLIAEFFQQNSPSVISLLKNLSFRNNFHHWFNDFQRNEDVFWGYYASNNFDWFRVPSINEAAKFALELAPKITYEQHGQQLPFGVHAWWTYDLQFWKPFIEKEGFCLNENIELAKTKC